MLILRRWFGIVKPRKSFYNDSRHLWHVGSHLCWRRLLAPSFSSFFLRQSGNIWCKTGRMGRSLAQQYSGKKCYAFQSSAIFSFKLTCRTKSWISIVSCKQTIHAKFWVRILSNLDYFISKIDWMQLNKYTE